MRIIKDVLLRDVEETIKNNQYSFENCDEIVVKIEDDKLLAAKKNCILLKELNISIRKGSMHKILEITEKKDRFEGEISYKCEFLYDVYVFFNKDGYLYSLYEKENKGLAELISSQMNILNEYNEIAWNKCFSYCKNSVNILYLLCDIYYISEN